MQREMAIFAGSRSLSVSEMFGYQRCLPHSAVSFYRVRGLDLCAPWQISNDWSNQEQGNGDFSSVWTGCMCVCVCACICV